jgi:hypothetical protein
MKPNANKASREAIKEMTVAESLPAPASLVERYDQSWLEGIDIERIVSLEEGDGVRGIFRGSGPEIEITDTVTGEVKALGTWRIEVRPGIVVRLLDSAKLKREFPTIPVGRKVRVMRLGQINTRAGRRVTDYIVAPERE